MATLAEKLKKLKKQIPTEAAREFYGAPELERGERTLIGNIWERPQKAIAGGIQSKLTGGTFGRGFERGSLYPEEVPSFTEIGERLSGIPGFEQLPKAGMGADIATSPADLLLLLTSTPKGREVIGKLGRGAKGVSQRLGQKGFVRTGRERAIFDKVGEKVFHETSPRSAVDLSESIVDKTGLNVSSTPELALGQKGKGAIVEFDAIKLAGERGSFTGLTKPGSEFVGQEFRLIGGSSSPASIKSVTIKPNVKVDPRTIRTLKRFYNATKLPDGSIKFLKK